MFHVHKKENPYFFLHQKKCGTHSGKVQDPVAMVTTQKAKKKHVLEIPSAEIGKLKTL